MRNTIAGPMAWVAGSLLIASCAEWPRHAHLPESGSTRAEGDVHPRDALWDQVVWTEGLLESTMNEVPSDPRVLHVGQGLVREGSLEGWGWDEDGSTPLSTDSECGNPPAFPPQEGGYYSGDVDWVTIQADFSGTLCASVRLRLEGDQASRRFDLVPYTLDACSVPIAAHRHPTTSDTGLSPVLGYPLGGTEGEWGTRVQDDEPVGIALAGWSPEDAPGTSASVVDWVLAISLVATGSGDEAGLCPRMPEDL